ncbi:MAG TPA: hypothetical protein VNN80_08775, partial [Polyangiaceae bacterium]|nr:hypothetical protein [Polyangiaceae bacterium]
MARFLARHASPVNLAYVALLAACACSAPTDAGDEGDAVPEFSGAPPGVNGAVPPVQQNPAAASG